MEELITRLKNYADSDVLPMHMPGHKRRMEGIGDPYFVDITEIDGFDNLHHAEGVLLEAQKKAASLYGSEETHYLTGGSTTGILSSISGCTTPGGKLLMARNSHKSVYHAAFLMGLQTEYIYPQSEEEMGINGPILPEEVENICRQNPDAQAVLITSPTYDGVVSDVKRIAEIVHSYGMPLIVDEAHGAHFPFSREFPADSIFCKADVVIHSLHKTLPALTQTALIHLNGDLVDREKIRRYLTIYQTSSPSYVLMASIDRCIHWIEENPEAFSIFTENLKEFRNELNRFENLKLLEVPGMDPSKILISVRKTELSGNQLSDILRKQYHIEVEMACQTYLCAITTVCDTKESLQRFRDALLEIDQSLKQSQKRSSKALRADMDTIIQAEKVMNIQSAMNQQHEWVPLSLASRRISGDFVTMYPPGIPLLAPGERISEEMTEKINRCLRQGFDIHGIEHHRLLVLS